MTNWRTANPHPDRDEDACLVGRHAIASFMGLHPSTIDRMIKRMGFPATKTPQGKWFTTKEAIIRYISACSLNRLDEYLPRSQADQFGRFLREVRKLYTEQRS